ncbi:GGDEF domain-containing protein [Syntrophotalea acetylenivorans]|uniref:GGDEF domain-containing protein n=1 Tax=Syntrophotalea acetylenivorans TaxID=1842532 RepID=UPI001F241ADF|nr:GGDEF domain-containing protein [Syntrophotalea acetylenivorans]
MSAICLAQNVVEDDPDMLTEILHDILVGEQLTALFQPIVDLKGGGIVGYESLVRGPSNSPLHSPSNLFSVAARCGRLLELDLLCREVNIRAFARQGLPGRLFLNVNPSSLLEPGFRAGFTRQFLHQHGLSPQQVVIELTEHYPVDDFEVTRQGVAHYRDMGFAVAIDDLGAGYSGLRLWSELQPDFVKFDRHFIQGIHGDENKARFIRSLQEIAHELGCKTIAEGVETDEEYRLVGGIGVSLGQGYYFARPSVAPPRHLHSLQRLQPTRENTCYLPRRTKTVECLAQTMPAVEPQVKVAEVGDMFSSMANLKTLPVVGEGDIPVGIVHRNTFMEIIGSRYGRDLYGREPIVKFMDAEPLVIDKNQPIEILSQLITSAGNFNALDHFIVTDKGLYAGIGTVMDLLREITDLQIKHARHANPLTLLPGNVPLNEHIDMLLEEGGEFVACYCDLDNFKPFNDYYGYGRGDQVLRFFSRLLVETVDSQCDFVGHIGGDDFMVVFQSGYWLERCQSLIKNFDRDVAAYYDPKDRLKNGLWSESRTGLPTFFPVISLSIGATVAADGNFSSCHQIAAAATEVKRQAKKQQGSVLCIDRRNEKQTFKVSCDELSATLMKANERLV